jgi:holin-like protein
MSLGFITVLLVCQLVGEVVSRLLDVPLPGPVIGMLVLFAGLCLHGRIPDDLQTVASGLLNNLSLLFVPAGVGVVTHLGLVAQAWLPITVALVVSVVLTIAVTALVFARLCTRLGQPPEGEASNPDGRV